MAIGSIINLGGGGGSISGAKGVIICDTSTMTVGDTIRVRDVYDSQNVQNKQVVTVGTPVIFEVEPYCYYKICMVQTISDVETEIGGVYKTVDLGQTLYIDVLDKTTVGGLQGILNAHQENDLLDVGDEVNVYVGGSPVKFQVAGINLYASHEVILVSKYLPTLQSAWSSGGDQYSASILAQTMSTYYGSIDQKDKQYIKLKTVNSATNGGSGINSSDHYVWNPTAWEINGNGQYYLPSIEAQYNVKFPIFTSQAGRIKKLENEQGTTNSYWTGSRSGTGGYCLIMGADGNSINNGSTSSAYILPAFHLLADS